MIRFVKILMFATEVSAADDAVIFVVVDAAFFRESVIIALINLMKRLTPSILINSQCRKSFEISLNRTVRIKMTYST